MAYRQDANIKLKHQRSKQAVALAMQGRWQEAIAANKLIIENFPRDVEAYNRLGRAYMELGEYSAAREAYQQALAIDPYNTIAKKNLDRLSNLSEAPVTPAVDSVHASPHIFIEEIGKAGVLDLYHLAPKEVLARTVAGDLVNLTVEGNNLIATSRMGEYLGQVEPRHAQRLIKLMQGGNKYTAAVVSSAEDKVTMIIREVYQDPSQADQLSFPPKGLKGVRPHLEGKLLRGEGESEEEVPESTDIYEDPSGSQE